MHALVRKTLEIYINEKRIITQADIPANILAMMWKKEAVFVTLYYNGRVIASSWRIQCQKEDTIYEVIDNTLMCLKDPRFVESLQNAENLANIHIRVDLFNSENRRMIQHISDLSVRDEWLIFLSQNLWVMSVILPNMVQIDPTPEKYFALACQKAGIDKNTIVPSDYVIYAFKTKEFNDMV